MVRNKVVIVTGSSSGIGAAAAVKFAEEGASAVVLQGRNAAALKKVEEQVKATGKCHTLVIIGDILDSEVRKRIIDETIEKFNQLDILVNNAGIWKPPIPVREAPIEQFDDQFSVNVRCLILLTQRAIPHLIKTKGNIINISSVGSMKCRPGVAYYGMSKAALDHYTKCLAMELGPKGVRVNAINPSFIDDTEFMARQNVSPEVEQRVHNSAASYPLRRAGKAEEVANAIVYLASEKATFVTGITMLVDGGASLL